MTVGLKICNRLVIGKTVAAVLIFVQASDRHLKNPRAGRRLNVLYNIWHFIRGRSVFLITVYAVLGYRRK
jgi:hypothetical protein